MAGFAFNPSLYYSLTFRKEDFVNEVLSEIRKQLNLAFLNIKSPVQKRVRAAAIDSLTSAVEYISMLPGGELYGQVGVIDIQSVLDEIVNVIVKNLKVEVVFPKRNGDQITGGILIIFEIDYNTLYRIENASFISENGFDVDWLRWLLEEGVRSVVLGYDYFFEPFKQKFSRTETGFMRLNKKGVWGFEPPFAGTKDDNWITRSLEQIQPLIQGILEEEVNKRLS